MMDCKDLYSTPVSAIPGCGFLLGTLLKREGICRASDLYDRFKKENRKNFTSFLECKLGKWNAIYSSVGKKLDGSIVAVAGICSPIGPPYSNSLITLSLTLYPP